MGEAARAALYEAAHEALRNAQVGGANPIRDIVDMTWPIAFAAGVEEGRRLVRAEVGICGDLSPALTGFDDRRVACDLLAGHDGWHSHPNDDGVSRMSWYAMDPEVAEVVADTIEKFEESRRV